MDFAMDESLNVITITQEGNGIILPRIEISVNSSLNAPLTITNLIDNSSFVLDISAESGDKLVIDSKTQQCTKNGKNIAYLRQVGSVWMVGQ